MFFKFVFPCISEWVAFLFILQFKYKKVTRNISLLNKWIKGYFTIEYNALAALITRVPPTCTKCEF